MNARDVRYGSGTDVNLTLNYVRFNPDNGHQGATGKVVDSTPDIRQYQITHKYWTSAPP